MIDSTLTAQRYYAAPGIMTDPGDAAAHFDSLPTDISTLVRVVRGLMLHVFWAERYGYKPDEARQRELQLRTVPGKLQRIFELDDHPLTVARPVERRLIGNCRDFTVLLCAMLQHQGVPARARCGFGAYFMPDHYEDHWVCEYWNADQGRWMLVDAQLDALQEDVLHVGFDTLDVPRDQFITGGKAWQMARRGEADPHAFGIFDMHGMAFIRGDLVRDFLALNKIEILPWDDWGLIAHSDDEAISQDVTLMDHMAELTLGGDETFDVLRALYEDDARLHPAPRWQP
ncbi:MAG: transglutaminase domain-containing protein [Anaerolineae bacterium]|nr:transglutaminase domain-containing protein [Anaerolineae bacterium]